MSDAGTPEVGAGPVPSEGGIARPARWGWVVLSALVALELVTFATYARREIVGVYPGHFDQPEYLRYTYTISRDVPAHGLVGAARAHLAKAQASGVLLPIQAAVHGAVLGPGRFAALSVNFLHFVGFQLAFAATLLWASRNWGIALAGFGLTLALESLFQPAGGMFDFRLDFAAFCMFGVLLCALVRSRLLLGSRWGAAVGCVAGVLVLFRFITAVYLTGIFGALAAVLLMRRLTARAPDARTRAVERLRGWGAAVAVAALVAGPVLCQNRKAIWAYYVVGHVTSSEKDIRAGEQYHNNPFASKFYYAQSIVAHHTGPMFWQCAAILGALGAVGLVRPARARAGDSEPSGAPVGWRVLLVVAAVGFLVPFAALSANAVKSPAVGAVLLPALLWFVLAPAVAAAGRWRYAWGGHLVGTAVLLGGTVAVLDNAAVPTPYTRTGDGPETMRALDDIADACHRKGIKSPELFVDAVTPEFRGAVLQVAEFERHGRWREYRDDGATIFAGEEATHLERLHRSDVVVLAGRPVGEFKYPFDQTMEKMRPQLQAYCGANLQKVGEYRIGGRSVTTYVRGYLRIEGLTDDGWVTDKGVDLTGTIGDLKDCRHIELHRTVVANYLGRVPGVTAEVVCADGSARPLAVTTTADFGAVSVAWEPVDLPADAPVTVRVRFDSSFVPRDLGISPDARPLVMYLGTDPRVRLH